VAPARIEISLGLSLLPPVRTVSVADLGVEKMTRLEKLAVSKMLEDAKRIDNAVNMYAFISDRLQWIMGAKAVDLRKYVKG
jgi:hypothetical protein